MGLAMMDGGMHGGWSISLVVSRLQGEKATGMWSFAGQQGRQGKSGGKSETRGATKPWRHRSRVPWCGLEHVPSCAVMVRVAF
jgi:hypothetical protein